MDTAAKERLAMTRNDSPKAAAVRLTAARRFAGLGQEGLGAHAGVSKSAISNSEKGRSFPGRKLMKYLFNEHRIDFNFLVYGLYVQLLSDVQDRLFPILEDVHSEWDQEPNSD